MQFLRLALLFGLAGSVVAFPPPDQKPVPQRADSAPSQRGADLIELSVVVTDGNGAVIEGLAEKDFELAEDHVQQPIVVFEAVKGERDTDSAPLLRARTAVTTPPAESGAVGHGSTRNLVLFADTVHITPKAIENVRIAMKRFVADLVADRDLVAVMASTGKPGVKGEFSRDRDKLEAEITRLRSGQAEIDSFLTAALCGRVIRRMPEAVSLATVIIASDDRTTGSVIAPSRANEEAEAVAKCSMLLLETASRRRRTIAAVEGAVDRLSSMPGQRIIALFSEGFSMTAPGGEPAFSEIRPAISAATRAGVMVYAFDARMALATKHVNIEAYSLASEIQSAVRDHQHGVALLASQTGGEAFLNSDALGDQLRRMLVENRTYYRLAYQAVPGGDPTKYRSIAVAIKRHPEYQVRTQKGYVPRDLQRRK